MHLPYAYQAKRMFPDVFRHDREDTEMWKEVAKQLGPAPEPHNSDDPVIIEIWEKAMEVIAEQFLKPRNILIFTPVASKRANVLVV